MSEEAEASAADEGDPVDPEAVTFRAVVLHLENEEAAAERVLSAPRSRQGTEHEAGHVLANDGSTVYAGRTSEGGGTSSREGSPPQGAYGSAGSPKAHGERGGSRGRGRSKSRTGKDALKMLSVSDAVTGVCLYQRRWRWQDAKEPDGIGKLVMSFYQFARDMDEGEISCVNFELTPSPRAHRRGASAHHSARRGQRNVSKTPQEAVQMLSCQDERIIVAVFHEVKAVTVTADNCEQTPSLQQFCWDCRDNFSALYAEKMGELRPTLRKMADEATEGDMVELQRNFWAFEDKVEELREQCFPSWKP